MKADTMPMNAGIIFSPLLGEISHSAGFRMALGAIVFLITAAVAAEIIVLIHFFLTLPMRRAERARLFLNLVEGALERGQPVEGMILSVAQSRERSVGVRFHLLAAHVESGLSLMAALEEVPSYLPPQIAAMLRAGEKLGDLKKVLPACGEILRDRPAGVRSAMHYMLLVVLLFSPVFIFVVMFTTIVVIPRFRDVAAVVGARLGSETLFVFGHTRWLAGFELLMFLPLGLITFLYIAGPQFARRFQFRGLPIVDWIAWHIPWKQKRLQRTFSAMLAVLLDGGVPDAMAVRLAGDCTANEICGRRTQRAAAAIEQGIKLDEALRAFDDSGEFHWRLTNAIHARGGFLNALRGWHEALDARAFQQEEATAHAVTSGIVILNGLLVALIATAMFGIFVVMLGRGLAL
jgi:type II secretory pathway component PulF